MIFTKAMLAVRSVLGLWLLRRLKRITRSKAKLLAVPTEVDLLTLAVGTIAVASIGVPG
eukprot:CAMPEP_0178743536 /NCGR_PEP_ID=MMETSP0744-20121128/6259_1 /TAXON_ID=913974 /ORGANISM="Nitzschia punctata, Strain CCMP561" /LENGTH=58 /DNA_ID=CAMNT_0020396549 /DNA_START=945 /DNA_END=1121 /DNA_ORIENTATION=+